MGGDLASEIDRTTSISPTKRWKRTQEILKHFWSRWMREWLPSISNRKKWECDQVDIEVGDVAIMKDAERGKWPLGKVVEITEAKDETCETSKSINCWQDLRKRN